MEIQGIASWTTPWYFIIVPSLCVYYDREEEAAGVAFMWLNFIVGVQARVDDTTVNNNNND